MLNKRSLVVFAATFAFVLIGGMALAGVGTFSNDVSDVEPADLSAGETTSDVAEESPTPTEKPPAAEPEGKPKDKPAEEPKEEPKAKPAAEPKEEPKPEPTDEPKEAADTTPPVIEVLFPEDGAHTKNAVQVFEGVPSRKPQSPEGSSAPRGTAKVGASSSCSPPARIGSRSWQRTRRAINRRIG